MKAQPISTADDQAGAVAKLIRFTSFSRLSGADLAGLATLLGPIHHLQRGDVIFSEGDERPGLRLLLDGWTASSVAMADGARQMIKVHMPGDVLGLPSLALQRAADSVTALSAVTLSTIPLPTLGALFEDQPKLAGILFLISQEERVMLMDRLTVIGCKTGHERIAALIVQLHARARRYDPTIQATFDLPLTQHEVGDLCGLASVQVNRSIQRLRKDQLLSWGRGRLTIHDLEGLKRLSGLPSRSLAVEQSWLPPSR